MILLCNAYQNQYFTVSHGGIMGLPNTLKELQNLYEDNSLRFKGKPKAQLRELLGEKTL